MQVSASASSPFHHLKLHIFKSVHPSAKPAFEPGPAPVALPEHGPVDEPRLVSDVRVAAEEIAAGLVSDKAAEKPGGPPHAKLRGRIAQLDSMVRKRMAHFAESQGAEDPQLQGELRSVSRGFHTAVSEAWKGFLNGDTDRAGLMREVRAAFEVAKSGFQSAASGAAQSGATPPVVEAVETSTAEAATSTSATGSSSAVPGVTVTVTKAAPPVQAPQTNAQQLDPLEALQTAIAELGEHFQTQMTSISELLAEVFGQQGQTQEGPSVGFEFGVAMKIYAELGFATGNTLGGQLNITS